MSKTKPQAKLRKEPKPEVIDLRVRKPKPVKLWPWALIGLILLSTGTLVGIERSIGQIPPLTKTSSGPSTTKIATDKTPTPPSSNGTPTPTGGTSPPPPSPPPPPTQTVTLVHGRAWSTTFLAQTIEFSGPSAYYVAINYDPNSVNYREFSVYLPNGSYGVAIWQNTTPSDTRPICDVRNGILNPFVVNGQAELVQDFTC
jgi:hypothetical protein